MPEYGYALENFDKSRHVRASIRDKSTSHKHAREVAVAIKGMSIEKARLFLEDVIARKIVYHIEDTIMRLLIDLTYVMDFVLVVILRKRPRKS